MRAAGGARRSSLSVPAPSVRCMGNFYRRDGMGVVELAPAHCPAGHALGPQKVLVGTQPCQCAGIAHRTWQCVTCATVMVWPRCTDHPHWVPWEGEP